MEESGPLPDVRPADRKRRRDMRFMLKSDGRLQGPLNISLAAKCTIRSDGEKVLNDGSQVLQRQNLDIVQHFFKTSSMTP